MATFKPNLKKGAISVHQGDTVLGAIVTVVGAPRRYRPNPFDHTVQDLAAILEQMGIKVTVHADMPAMEAKQTRQQTVLAAAQALRLSKGKSKTAVVAKPVKKAAAKTAKKAVKPAKSRRG